MWNKVNLLVDFNRIEFRFYISKICHQTKVEELSMLYC